MLNRDPLICFLASEIRYEGQDHTQKQSKSLHWSNIKRSRTRKHQHSRQVNRQERSNSSLLQEMKQIINQMNIKQERHTNKPKKAISEPAHFSIVLRDNGSPFKTEDGQRNSKNAKLPIIFAHRCPLSRNKHAKKLKTSINSIKEDSTFYVIPKGY